MAFQSFTDLEVYKECRQLRKTISTLTKTNFPPEEKYKLTGSDSRFGNSIQVKDDLLVDSRQ